MNAVLFDLDGTLLPLDHMEFIECYLRLLAGHVSRYMETKRFIRQLLASTDAMIADLRPDYTNEQVFTAHFCSGMGMAQEEVIPLFDEFYATGYTTLQSIVRPHRAAREAVQAVLGQGLTVVLATNPLFPLAAVRQRMEWAHIADLPFARVTSFETSHYCKPQTAYYREILDWLGYRPEDCLMVGNDVEEDLIAAEIGIRTYLVDDLMLNSKNLAAAPDYRGSLLEMARFMARSDLRSL